jgi:Polysaccharide deacetylase
MDFVKTEPLLPVSAKSLVPSEAPVFCFTTDIEWAPEWAIREMLSFFRERGLPLTPFLTHSSAAVTEHYDRPGMRRRTGVHPNFLANSSHGKTREEVIDTMFKLWPQAVSFRAHWFYEDSGTTLALKQRGVLYDSNLCLFLQPSCVPLLHNSGLVRFPVFWEDDVHFTKGLPFQFAPFREHFETPGLKVINLHPLIFALNIPTPEFYAAHKHMNRSPDPEAGKKARFAGAGARTFLEEVADHVQRTKAVAMYLDDLYQSLL